MGAWYFKQPNKMYGRFSTIVDTVTNYNMTKDELHQNMIDRFGKYDADVLDFEGFINGKHSYKLHEFDDVLNEMTYSNETTESAQKLLIEMGMPQEEAVKYHFMDDPGDVPDDDPIWDTFTGNLIKDN